MQISSSTKPAATRRPLPALWAGLSPLRRLAGALTGLVVLLTLGSAQLRDVLDMPSQMLLYLLAVVAVALVGGLVPALAAAVVAAALLASAVVLGTGRPARIDDFSQASDAYGDAIRRLGLRSGVVAPIVVEGRLWGAIAVGTRRERFPADTEQRTADFTELIGTAIGNTEVRAQPEESRDQLHRLTQEQAALRRVATLVARRRWGGHRSHSSGGKPPCAAA